MHPIKNLFIYIFNRQLIAVVALIKLLNQLNILIRVIISNECLLFGE